MYDVPFSITFRKNKNNLDFMLSRISSLVLWEFEIADVDCSLCYIKLYIISNDPSTIYLNDKYGSPYV